MLDWQCMYIGIAERREEDGREKEKKEKGSERKR